MNPYRIARRFIDNPALADGGYYEFKVIELIYDVDTDDPLYLKYFQEVKTQEELDLSPLPIKIVNYSEANLLSKWGNIIELKDAYKSIEAAFKKPVIDLDMFPLEIENELVKKSKK